MPCLLAQLHQKLQLDYRTTVTQNHQKIELHGSLTTKELKKSHSSRWVGTAQMWRCEGRCGDAEWQSHNSMCWIKIGRDTSGMRYPSPIPDHQAQGSRARKMSPYNFCCKNQWGLGHHKKQQDSKVSHLK